MVGGEVRLSKSIVRKYIRLLEDFPNIRKDKMTIFHWRENRSLSGYRVTDKFLCDSAIHGLWKATDQNLTTFHLAIDGLTHDQKEFVLKRIEVAAGNFNFFDPERKRKILCDELLRNGYKIERHHFFVYGWVIKRPGFFGRKFEIVGYDDLEGFFREEIGEPNYYQ